MIDDIFCSKPKTTLNYQFKVVEYKWFKIQNDNL